MFRTMTEINGRKSTSAPASVRDGSHHEQFEEKSDRGSRVQRRLRGFAQAAVLVLAAALTLAGCGGGSGGGSDAPSAEFETDLAVQSFMVPTSDEPVVAVGAVISFENTSSNADSYVWNFGDGVTSTQLNPTHQYASAGTYEVMLEAMSGDLSDESDPLVVPVVSAPIASFELPPTPGGRPYVVGEAVAFDNTSSPSQNDDASENDDDYDWTFGDGTTSTIASPVQVFEAPGSYTVSLTARAFDGVLEDTATLTVLVEAAPEAGFTVSPMVPSVGANVAFSAVSLAADSYVWDFGDGSAAGTGTNPSHVYTSTGTFNVTLTASTGNTTDQQSMTVMVAANADPVALFIAGPNPAAAGQTVAFSNVSTNASSYSWNFGDGSGTSTNENPSHAFANAGSTPVSYDVSLSAFGGFGTNPSTSSVAVTVNPAPPICNFSLSTSNGQDPLTVSVTQQSTRATAWSWNFGNGETSTQESPPSVEFEEGDYTVTLDCSNAGGAGASVSRTVSVEPGPPIADFAVSASAGEGPLEVQFTDTSKGSVEFWDWNFAGLGTSSEPNPTFTFENVGVYEVTLTVAASGFNPDTTMQEITVTVIDPSFEQSFPGDSVGEIDGGWESLTVFDGFSQTQHLVLSASVAFPDQVAGTDPEFGSPGTRMPTNGTRWAVLDGATDGTGGMPGGPLGQFDQNGISIDFIPPPNEPVVMVDFAFIHVETPFTATFTDRLRIQVSDGVNTQNLTGADTGTVYTGPSSRFAGYAPDGSSCQFEGVESPMITVVQTAAVNVDQAFPNRDPRQTLTLNIRLGNTGDDVLDPFGYVDNLRFAGLDQADIEADIEFTVGIPPSTDPLSPFVGDELFFRADGPDSRGAADRFFWEFDKPTVPLSPCREATGSAEAEPVFLVESGGEKQATVRVFKNGSVQGDFDEVTVLVTTPPEAVIQAEMMTDPVSLVPFADVYTFMDDSSAGTTEPIISWVWDFGDGTFSTQQDPGQKVYSTPGTYVVSLMIETAGGLVDETQQVILVTQGFPAVFNEIQNSGCAAGGCHTLNNPAAGMSLATEAGAFAALRMRPPSPASSCFNFNGYRVDPGNLATSLIWDKANPPASCGSAMPWTGGLDVLQAWIQGGALR